MLTIMCEFFRSILDSVSAFTTQLHAALSIPLTDPVQLDESEIAGSNSIRPWERERSFVKSFKCIDDHPGYLTSNGLGSLEIGAAYDD